MGIRMGIFGWPTLGLGFIVGLAGLLSLLGGLGVLPFSVGFLSVLYVNLAMYIFAALGLLVVIEDAMNLSMGGAMAWGGLFIGLLFLAMGIVNILNKFGVLGFGVPGLPEMVFHALFMLLGAALVMGTWD